MNRIARHFIQGLLIVVPGAVTIWVLYQIFILIDRLIALPIPGAGFVITLVGIFLVGLLASNLVLRKFFSLIETLFLRAPIARIIYFAIRDLIEAFVGERKRFNQPVLVSLPSLGDARILGFVTREDLRFLGLDHHVAVYLPQSYNFAGNLLLLPGERVEPLSLDPVQTMALIVSGGVSGFAPDGTSEPPRSTPVP